MDEPSPQAAFGVVEASHQEHGKEGGRESAGGTAGVAATPMCKAKVEAGYPKGRCRPDRALAASQQDEAETEFFIGSVDGGEGGGEPDERRPAGGLRSMRVVQDVLELFSEAKDGEEDEGRYEQRPPDGAETGDPGIEISGNEIDVSSGEAAGTE